MVCLSVSAQTFNSTSSTNISTNGVNYYNDISVTGIGTINAGGYEVKSVTINITHTWDSDLDIYLIAPDLTQLELSTDNGGSADNYINTVFSDNGSISCALGSAPFTGTFLPEVGSFLSLNNGQNADGTWRIKVYDDAAGDVGILNSWSITFEAPPTCPDPNSLSTSGIAATQANLTWTENGSATTWDIELGAAGFSPTGVPSVDNTSSNPYTYTGLSQNTSYDYYVRSDCGGGDESNWVGPFTFITTVTCPDPSALSASNITSSSADLSWTENGLATTWDIEFGQSGFAPTGTPTFSGVTSNPYSQTGLTPGTAYEFYVRSDCGGGDQSNWVGPYSFTTSILMGQVYVSATAGTANAIYPNMKGAFDKINDGTHMGDIVITVGDAAGQTILETAEAALNKNGVGAASYNSVIVYPGASDIKISGNLSGACCLVTGTVSLKEANNVIFDGRIGGTGSTIDLTIENTAVSSWASAFSLINASNNTIRHCKFKSSNSSTSGGAGTLVFKDNNAPGGDPGCDNNLVEYCHFTMAGSDKPNVAIASDGNVYSGGVEDHNDNIIRGCDIYNFQRFGIWLSGGSTSSTAAIADGGNRDWIIEENNIYQPMGFSSMSYDQIGICIGYPFDSGHSEYGSFIIRNNDIGGNGSGGKWVCTSTSSRRVAGIAINTWFTVDHTFIDGNIIHDFDVSTSNSTTDYGMFSGIVVSQGKTKIGSTKGNTIGSLADDSNILIHRTTTTNWPFASGIHVRSSLNVETSINNNVVSGIDLTSGSGLFGSFYGIRNSCATTYPQDSIYKNNVSYIRSTKVGTLYGIFGNGYIAKNRVRDIDFTGTGSSSRITGIQWYGGTSDGTNDRGVENNEVILGKNKAGTSVAQNDVIQGINITRGDAEVYHNSVLIEGDHTGSNHSYAYFINWSGGIIFKNNLGYNVRTGGLGKHYVVSRSNSGVDFNNTHNAYITGVNTDNLVGVVSGVDKPNLSDWSTATGEALALFETSSNKPVNTLFPMYSYDSLDVQDTWLVQGTYNLTTDIRDWVRGNPPTIGAYEINSALPVELLYFDGENQGRVNQLYWATASELNNDYFILERSNDAEIWTTLEFIDGHGTTDMTNYYTAIDPNPYEISYYRLIQVDFDGKQEVSQIVILRLSGEDLISDLYPNPTSGAAYFTIGNNVDFDDLGINVFNVLGQKVPCNMEFLNKRVQLNLSGFSPGSYQIVIELNDTRIVKKIIVQ